MFISTLVDAIAQFFASYGNADNVAQGVINWFFDCQEGLLVSFNASELTKLACNDLEFFGMTNAIAMREFFERYQSAILYEIALELEG